MKYKIGDIVRAYAPANKNIGILFDAKCKILQTGSRYYNLKIIQFNQPCNGLKVGEDIITLQKNIYPAFELSDETDKIFGDILNDI